MFHSLFLLFFFQVGGVKTEKNLKKRLSQYNIGTVKGLNDYQFLFTYVLPLSITFYQIENELKMKLKKNKIGNTEVYQYPLHSLRSQIENLDINSLTPVEALLKLNEIKKMVGG